MVQLQQVEDFILLVLFFTCQFHCFTIVNQTLWPSSLAGKEHVGPLKEELFHPQPSQL